MTYKIGDSLVAKVYNFFYRHDYRGYDARLFEWLEGFGYGFTTHNWWQDVD